MDSIQYIGEHILPGKLGHFFIILSFVASMLATIAYFFATQNRENDSFKNWKRIGRTSFIIHGLSTFVIIATIFYIMISQFYEYRYTWEHVSEDLQLKYIASAFWEGQEGSFLLWMFWHVILGFILIKTAKTWEAPVLSVLSSIQFFIGSMILGLYFTETFKLGINPFLFLRDTMDIPLFQNANYIEMIQGKGLNPLLQNYWMTIHPPTLFLGFASTSVPFAFAIAGLWTKRHREWLRPVFPWALFSGAILGLGILMGGAWAYEALSFGGYWAWDPVENMSLVPWIILIAGIHTNLVAKSTSYSIKSTYIFYLLSFVLIVYSTFLTRSGVLGESSVHAFTEMGLELQLVLFLAFFILLSLFAYFYRSREIPTPPSEENSSSKEFWLFIGSLVLLFSAFLITVSTSLPVYNQIYQYFDPAFEGIVITDPITHYNQYQLWIGVFIGLISGFTQFLRFKEKNWKINMPSFLKHIGIATLISAVLTFLTAQWIQANAWQYLLLMFAGIFTAVSNLDYLITYLRGNLKLAGSTFAHMGFGIMVIGVLASGLNKEHISTNPFANRGILDDESLKTNIMLVKGSPSFMSGWEVTYVKDTFERFNRTYEINYKRKDKKGKILEEFDLYPNILYNKQFTNIAASNPSTQRYLTKDIFTHIASLPQAESNVEVAKEINDSLKFQKFEYPLGKTFAVKDTIRATDSIYVRTHYVTIESISKKPSHPDYIAEDGDITIGAKVSIQKHQSKELIYSEPMLVLRGQYIHNFPIQVNELAWKIRLPNTMFEDIFIPEKELNYKDFTLKEGERFTFGEQEIIFTGFNQKATHPAYTAEEGDIAVSAMLRINDKKNGQTHFAQPMYLIRNSRPFNLKSEVQSLGLHFRFIEVNPKNETIRLQIAQADPDAANLFLEIAKNSPRTDWIVLEAILFPGINLFWLGTLMMVMGLTMGMFFRMKN